MNTEKIGGAVRYASRTTGVNFEKILTWAAIGGVAFVALKIYQTGSAVKGALNSVGSAIGTGLYDLFHPNDGERATSPTWTFYFPDGTKGAVDSLDVDKFGRFNYWRTGRRYQLIVKKEITSGINKWAVPV